MRRVSASVAACDGNLHKPVNAFQAIMHGAKQAQRRETLAKELKIQDSDEKQLTAWIMEDSNTRGQYPVLGATPYCSRQPTDVNDLGRGELEDLIVVSKVPLVDIKKLISKDVLAALERTARVSNVLAPSAIEDRHVAGWVRAA